MNARSLALALLLALSLSTVSVPALAQQYSSSINRFAVGVNAPWSRTALPDPTAELFLLCEPSVCGPTVLLSFSAFFDPNLKTGKVADFLLHAKGEAITQEVRSSQMVSRVVILKEGRTMLGSAQAYEVLSELTLKDGRRRMRHTFMTFNAGYVYSVNLGCPPEAHTKALSLAKPILASFQFK
jgi:hypothetical protein